MDWRNSEHYAFCLGLDQAGWAWQFLRRNPAYRADYAWFIALWHGLESDYGAPPNRDFFRWRQDPRAWRAESELAGCGTEVCPGENEQVLIECWMGAKWGFRQFPVDPAESDPSTLAWREQPTTMESLEPGQIEHLQQSPGKIALLFDLALPLPSQLEAAKARLTAERHALAKTGELPVRSVREGRRIWVSWLRLLDGLDRGISLEELGRVLDLAAPDADRAGAERMMGGEYRRILLMDR
jgi:hypothetical protein